ncbi:MAG: hypothetical protein ACLUH5_00870 [Eubacterium sp.]
MNSNILIAHPIRVIPFDLGRTLQDNDINHIRLYIEANFKINQITPRQQSILKDCKLVFALNDQVSGYIYKKGILVIVIEESKLDFHRDYLNFSITYGKNRKEAHNLLFNWKHEYSSQIFVLLRDLWQIVKKNCKNEVMRLSASNKFENCGLSYIMTLSLFEVSNNIVGSVGFNEYPDWLKSNLYALLDPAILYLEDSSKFDVSDVEFDTKRILKEIAFKDVPKDYEIHRHIDTYMSWAAVVVIGQIQDIDIEEYTALEVQLQSDWYYVYCIEKNLKEDVKLGKQDVIRYQQQSYELDLLENRLYDFDDSSMPTRILEIQNGLIQTSGINDNIQHAQRKIKYILEREKLNNELRQKKLGQSSEVLLFFIAFIEIAPTVAEYGNKLFPNGGIIANIIIVILGLVLLMRKDS